MSSLLLSNGVYWLEIKSVRLVFSTGFAPLIFSLVSSPLPSPPSLCEYVIVLYNTHIQECKGWGRGGWVRRRGGDLRQIKHVPQSPFTGQFFKNQMDSCLSNAVEILTLGITCTSIIKSFRCYVLFIYFDKLELWHLKVQSFPSLPVFYIKMC